MHTVPVQMAPMILYKQDQLLILVVIRCNISPANISMDNDLVLFLDGEKGVPNEGVTR